MKISRFLLLAAMLATPFCGAESRHEFAGDAKATASADFPAIALERYADGLTMPVALTHSGDGSGRLFVVEQRGRIRIVRGGVDPVPFLDIVSRVRCCGERGLLGLAFHPQYRTNGRFFVNYTDLSGATVIAEYRADPGAATADPNSERVVLRIAQPFSNHNGGYLLFGPDGHLWIGTGDGGSAGDPGNRAQTLTDLLGKMLRIDVDRGVPYAIPTDNPFVGRADAAPEVWASGLRNPWRYSFDADTGDLWIGDVGQNAWEEIDFAPASSTGGENYGWRIMEGAHCFNPSSGCNRSGLVLPVAEYPHSGRDCSVTGGFVYRGNRHLPLRGIYFFADYCSGIIRAVRRAPSGGWESADLLSSGLVISSFGEDEDGEIYVLDHTGGSIHRLTGERGSRRRAVRR